MKVDISSSLRLAVVEAMEINTRRLDYGLKHYQEFLAVGSAFEGFNVITSTLYGSDFSISISGTAEDLIRACTALADLGYSPDKKDKGETTPAGFSNYFRREGGACVWLHFVSSVCRRVKTGTKMVEQDVYEMVCDEGVPAQATGTDNDIPF